MLLYVRTVINSRMNSDKGASAVEYGLLIAAIAAVIVVIVFALGGTIRDVFDSTNDCVESRGAAGCPAEAP